MSTIFEKPQMAPLPVDAAPISWDHWYQATFDCDKIAPDGKAYGLILTQPLNATTWRGELEIVNAFLVHEIRIGYWSANNGNWGTGIADAYTLDIQQANTSWFGQAVETRTLTASLTRGVPVRPAREVPASTKLQVIWTDLFGLGASPIQAQVILLGTEPTLRQFPVVRPTIRK